MASRWTSGSAESGALRGMSGGLSGYRVRYGGFGAGINIRRRAALAILLAVAALPAPAAGETRLLAFGDSLVSGWGLAARDAFPAALERALHAAGRGDVRVIAAGVAGDTSAGGRARLAWSLAERPDAAIVELGANDGLRGIDPAATYANLDAILAELKRRGIPVLLAGMYAPPNLGREYGAAFDAVYPGLAEKHGVSLYPFFLDGVAVEPGLNQPDGLHPNASGVAVIVERILPYVMRVLP